MLRGWDTERQKDEWSNAFSSHDQSETIASSGGVLRDWSAPSAPEVHDRHEEKVEIEEEIGLDPLASPSGSVSSGWSMPHAVLPDVDSVPAPFADEVPMNRNKYPAASDSGSENPLQILPPNLQTIDSEFSRGDVEACSPGMPPSGYDDNINLHRKSSIRQTICHKLQEVRTNPAAKFKLIVGASIFVVTICIIAIAVTASSDNNSAPSNGAAPMKGTGIDTTVGAETTPVENSDSKHERIDGTNNPTPAPVYNTSAPLLVALMNFTDIPTFSPTAIPTYTMKLPTVNPTSLQTYPPSPSPITPSPTEDPITSSPTMDCSDATGNYMTYNDKPRDCIWLDNGHNGAKSDRKDLNCLSSDLGDKCRYTCRLYNGCMNDLLARMDTLPEEDFSIGDSCLDKEGTFMGNNHIPRNCSWIEEDPLTAPLKKSLNCGTPEDPRTELGAMCPWSCAGYNECSRDVNAMSASNSTVDVDAYFYDDDKDNGYYDDDDDGDAGPMPTLAPTYDTAKGSSSEMPTYLEPASTSVPTVETCIDAHGEFQTHVGTDHYRQCRWFNRDGDGITTEDKKRLNCHITEIGMNCLETCGCVDNESAALEVEDKQSDKCEDPTGLFETHEPGELEQCDWLDLENSDEKKKLNCGLTELGNNCICRCPVYGHNPSQNVLIQDVAWDMQGKNWDYSRVTPRPSKSPTPAPKNFEGQLDASGKLLTLAPYADATVSQNDPDENYGDSLVLRVSPADNKMQSLILFDLSYVSMNFGATFGSAMLRLYATQGSLSGGVTFKQMAGANWDEKSVTWHKTPGREGSNELILAFLNNVDADEWYDLDVTAAVRDTLVHGQKYLSIRLESDETDVSFASKEREDVHPQLVVDSDTLSPTLKPTYAPSPSPSTSLTLSPMLKPTYAPSPSPSTSPIEPTSSPSTSPVVTLDCLDKKGKFKTNSGESQSCSWFDVGNGDLKKELNCVSGEAKMFCQSQCGEYNGCDDMTCEDRDGSYATHTGWTAECSWLTTGQGTLKLEQNCGTDAYPITELGKRCQDTCQDYNGCALHSLERADIQPMLESISDTASPTSQSSEKPTLSPPVNQANPTSSPTASPIVELDCLDHEGTFTTNSGESQTCSWFDDGNSNLKKELNCQGKREARLFCQSQCGKYNGCGDTTCKDREGLYATHTGWSAECSWLTTGSGTLKLEQNCGTDAYPLTELGKRCQATCKDYNGCKLRMQ